MGYMFLLRGEHMERRRAREPVWDGWLACSASTATLDARFFDTVLAPIRWQKAGAYCPADLCSGRCRLNGDEKKYYDIELETRAPHARSTSHYSRARSSN